MNAHYRKLIEQEFEDCVQRTIERLQKEGTNRPFHSALLSNEVLYWSRFERSFSTSFGQRAIEEISRLTVLANGASDALRQKRTNFKLDSAYVNAIEAHVASIRHGAHYDWEESLAMIKSKEPEGITHALHVISDLWWKKDAINHYKRLSRISIRRQKPSAI